jgi:DNA uptake protein ComE-like DNA-binding protein
MAEKVWFQRAGILIVTDQRVLLAVGGHMEEWSYDKLLSVGAARDYRTDGRDGTWVIFDINWWGHWYRLADVKTRAHEVDAAAAYVNRHINPGNLSAELSASLSDPQFQLAEISRWAHQALTRPRAPERNGSAKTDAGRREPERSRRQPVDLSTATLAEIATLPGFDAELARRAIELRESPAGFESVDELGAALGLKPHHIAQVRAEATIGVALRARSTEHGTGRVVDY